jgi:DNA-binding MarR family transcriptional regulator
VTDPLSKRRLRLWIRLLRVTRMTEAQLREFMRVEHGSFMRVEHGSTLPRFDVMAALHRADGDLTMTELSRMLLVSNGNTTTVVDRLESDGLVTRTPSAGDRRVVHVALTAEGRQHFERLAIDHEAQVDSLFAGVSTSDLDALEAVLQRMTAGPTAVKGNT